jgi:hypothetical protein
MDYLDKLARIRINGDETGLPPDEQARKTFPLLWELLTCKTVFSDQGCLPAKLTIEVGLGTWQVSVFHSGLAMGIGTTSDTLQGAVQAMEECLARGVGWRASGKQEPRLRKLPEDKIKKSGRKRS